MIAEEKLTHNQKKAHNHKWYKDKFNEVIGNHDSGILDIAFYNKMKANYNLYNSIISQEDYESVCKPYGDTNLRHIPIMTNRDIVSPKVKQALKLLKDRPFNWQVYGINDDSISQKEKFEYQSTRDLLISEIMAPIKEQIMLEAEQMSGEGEVPEEKKKEIQEFIQSEMAARTPEEIKDISSRALEDIDETAHNDLLKYLMKSLETSYHTGLAAEHFLKSGFAIMYCGEFNGEIQEWVVNPLRCTYNFTEDENRIHKMDTFGVRYRMSYYNVVKLFGDELTDAQIKKIHTESMKQNQTDYTEHNLFSSEFDNALFYEGTSGVEVTHATFKALTKVGTTIDEEGNLILVDDGYSPKEGEEVSWKWYSEPHEVWRIGQDIYIKMNPVGDKFMDIYNLGEDDLPYVGVICDNQNAAPTSFVDRLAVYQYMYNVILHRVDVLIPQDKGKKVFLSQDVIPSSDTVEFKKWQYYFDLLGYSFVDTASEGKDVADLSKMVKVADMTLTSQIGQYIEFAEYIRGQAGKVIGVSESMEGQISASEEVGNVQRKIEQSTAALLPYMELFDKFKEDYLKALLKVAKKHYYGSGVQKLFYVLDDLSVKYFQLNGNSKSLKSLGLFVADPTDAANNREFIRQTAQISLHSQKLDYDAFLSLIDETNISKAKEILRNSEKEKMEEARQHELALKDKEIEKEQVKMQDKEEDHQRDLEKIRVEGEEKRKTEVVKGSFTAASFNPEQDVDGDGVNDFIEGIDKQFDNQIKRDKLELEKEKFNHKKKMDAKKKIQK